MALLILAASAAATTNAETARALGLSKFVLPEYPAMLRMEGVPQGEALLVMSRDSEGRPRDVLSLEATRADFADAAMEAVQAWRFLPAEGEKPTGVERPHLVRFIFKAGGVTLVAATRGKSVGGSAGYRPIAFVDLDRIPKPVRQPLPTFPVGLAGKVKTGEANLTFFVDETGRVRVPVVTAASEPEFGTAALEIVTTWTYEPPVRGGRPVVAYEALTIQFGTAPRM